MSIIYEIQSIKNSKGTGKEQEFRTTPKCSTEMLEAFHRDWNLEERRRKKLARVFPEQIMTLKKQHRIGGVVM
ncbi:hypothetical protein [Prevotella sp.]|uniref:hypothetical protein n=1 Tax=uncultured Prevotella sp. TaxID=159272 RepID=UPI0025D3E92C|nr:hypothetical protein [Prevotella sp.]